MNICVWLLFNILWWAQVTETPDVIKIIVFNRGILKGSKISIPVGGHFNPNSIVGDRLEWKNLQKNEVKNSTSDVINKIIPHFMPVITWLVWNPWKVLSRVISRHQVNMVSKITIMPISINIKDFRWNILVAPVNNIRTPIALVKGQGL